MLGCFASNFNFTMCLSKVIWPLIVLGSAIFRESNHIADYLAKSRCNRVNPLLNIFIFLLCWVLINYVCFCYFLSVFPNLVRLLLHSGWSSLTCLAVPNVLLASCLAVLSLWGTVMMWLDCYKSPARIIVYVSSLVGEDSICSHWWPTCCLGFFFLHVISILINLYSVALQFFS